MRILPVVLSVFLGVVACIATAGAPTPTATPPRAITAPAPAYDESERRAGHAGEVQILFRIAADGTVGEVRVARSSGWPILDASALDAARTWRFEPARDASGKPVAAQVQLPITFASAPAEPADPLAQARATSCARFLNEVSAYRLARDPLGAGSFGTVWGGLLRDFGAKYGQAAAMTKTRNAQRVFENTVASCRLAPSRSLGAAVEGEFYRIR
jgi:TonB family protein